MANRNGREALRGVEVQLLDLMFQASTPKQWAELLKGPLERAAAQGKKDIAQKLVEAGAQIGDAMHEAVGGGHREVVNDLLAMGASINAKDMGYIGTPLHVAAVQGKPEMAQLLMKNGADKDALDVDGWTPLLATAMFGQTAAALALLAGGADVNIRCGPFERSAILMAAEEGHAGILRAAIEHGADVGSVDRQQMTSLHFAAESNHADAIDVLVEAGGKIEARDRCSWTPLHFAADRLNLEAVTALLGHGAQVNAQRTDLRTPLYAAAIKAGTQEAAEVVDVLLRSGADETIIVGHGNTAANVVAHVLNVEIGFPEDVERVLKLLANAPADRVWRRRGYLVLCRAHRDRVDQAHESGSAHARRRKVRGCHENVEVTAMDEGIDADWASVAVKVLGLREEDIFRKIVEYL